ncbi:MAG: hypothetical protein HFJ41_03705 [Clostridia bacterium]|nr:hypothetical protein [Clostridia bacterium]
MNKELIKLNQKISSISKECRKNAKLENCVCCNKKVSSFCNSHSIPKFILKNIEKQGLVYTSNYFFELPAIKEEEGIMEAGTFHIICNECDNLIFKDYEDEINLTEYPTNKMLAEITLKNILVTWDKRLFEIQLYNKMKEISPCNSEAFNYKNEINYIDLEEEKWEYKRAKKIIDKNLKSGYRLIFSKKLDYIVPIAFQGHICLYGDLDGNIINDIYNNNSDIKMKYINICVFPLKDSSIIYMFYHKDDRNYYKFEKQFNRLTIDEKLQLISFIIINYSEEFYMSKNISNEITCNDFVKEASNNTTDFWAYFPGEALIHHAEKLVELLKYKSFPNILDRKYSIINIK